MSRSMICAIFHVDAHFASHSGRQASANPDAVEVDPPTSGLLLQVSNYSTGVVKIGNGLLGDSGFDVEGWLRDKFLKRFYRGVSSTIVNGDGGNVQSILAAYAAQGFTTTSVNKITYADFVTAIATLDPAYHANAVFRMSNASLGSVLSILDGNGRPIFLPGLGSADTGFVGTILGYSVKLLTQLRVWLPATFPCFSATSVRRTPFASRKRHRCSPLERALRRRLRDRFCGVHPRRRIRHGCGYPSAARHHRQVERQRKHGRLPHADSRQAPPHTDRLGAGFEAQVTHKVSIRYPIVPITSGMQVRHKAGTFLVQAVSDPDELKVSLD